MQRFSFYVTQKKFKTSAFNIFGYTYFATQDEKTNPHLKTFLCLREHSHITLTDRECGKSRTIDWYPMLTVSWGGEREKGLTNQLMSTSLKNNFHKVRGIWAKILKGECVQS